MFITRRITTPFIAHEVPEDGGQAPNVETPENAAQAANEQQPNAWEDRYKEAQAWGTREAQWRSQHEPVVSLFDAAKNGDPEAAQQILEALGYALPDDETDDTQLTGELDPRIVAALNKIDELDQGLNSITSEQQQTQQYQNYRDTFDSQIRELGVPDEFIDLVADTAIDLPALQTPQGPRPDLEGAMKQVEAMALTFAAHPAVQNQVKRSWADTKRTHHISPVGDAGTQKPDYDNWTKSQINEYMAQQAAAQIQDQHGP